MGLGAHLCAKPGPSPFAGKYGMVDMDAAMKVDTRKWNPIGRDFKLRYKLAWLLLWSWCLLAPLAIEWRHMTWHIFLVMTGFAMLAWLSWGHCE